MKKIIMDTTSSQHKRISFFYGVLIVVAIIFIVRLFYLQVIQHDYYQTQAQANQLKRYEIPADRGTILASDGEESVSIVLNERRYNIIADPQIIKDKQQVAHKLSKVLNIDESEVLGMLNTASRYEIVAKKQTTQVKDVIEKLYAEGEIVGVFAEKTVQRVYPQGTLAASLLGFVNDEGEGRYGIEQALNSDLAGTPGMVKALTDQDGVPLLAGGENTLEDPTDGKNIQLTIDVAIQRQAEALLKQGLDKAQSSSGDVIIMDPKTGAIKAMASYPSYDPAKFSKIEDQSLFINPAVSSPLEPGSVVKTLTAAAALDTGSVSREQTYFDPSFYRIDGAVVRNIEEDGGAATRSVSDILKFSLNTGATWLLMQMGNGELNEQGRKVWHDYMVNHYQFGSVTGIEQGYQEPGIIPDPEEGYGLNIKYANTSFGQGMTVTSLQMISAVASVVNGGTYYQPTLVAASSDPGEDMKPNAPVVVKNRVVSPETSATMVEFMQTIVAGNSSTRGLQREGYIVGGKTGTAEIARPEGGYYEDKFNGTYVGFVGGDSPEYVIFVRVNDPGVGGYAGSQAAAPLFGSLVNMLIDNFSVKSQSR
jgi:cell division protein FtsI/penicillin-binding protein 2